MPRNIQAMIVEDNRQLAESIRSFFAMKNMIDIVDIAFDSSDAIEKLKILKLDVIILDLIMPHSDGFVLLEHLHKHRGGIRPEVIILSSLGNEVTIKRACDLGAIYYMMKPFSMEDLHERIMNIIGNGENSWSRSVQPPSGAKSREQRLSALLSDFGISKQHKGYRYLCEAVNLVIAQPDLMNSLTKRLYPEIGVKFNSSPLAVERSMRRAIEVAYSDEAFQSNDSPSPQRRLSNGEFISLVSSRVLSCVSE